jgi:hypothetical protein
MASLTQGSPELTRLRAASPLGPEQGDLGANFCYLGISYAWVDTCYIDKTGSAELSEATNSMFA